MSNPACVSSRTWHLYRNGAGLFLQSRSPHGALYILFCAYSRRAKSVALRRCGLAVNVTTSQQQHNGSGLRGIHVPMPSPRTPCRLSLFTVRPIQWSRDGNWRRFRGGGHRRRCHRAGEGTCPPMSDSGSTGAQQNLWGTCKKIIKKYLMKKPNIQQRKCSACHPLATDTLVNSFVDHTVFYVGA